MKRKLVILLCLVRLLLPLSVLAQEPDLSKLDDKDKLRTWLAYCESLRINQKGVQGNYAALQQAGLKGLQLTKPSDQDSRSSFFIYVAIGYYYQVKFDSAQYYFYESLHSAQQAGSATRISKACVALIPVNFQLQQQQKVEECKNILQSIMDTTKNIALLQDGYYALGSYYQQKSYYSTAQDYFIKSLESRERQVDTTQDPKKKFDYAIQCDMLSKLYLNTQMMDKSLQALRQGQRFSSVSPVVGNRLLSSFVEAFTQSGNIDSALYYDNELEKATANSPQFPSERVSSDLNIAIYFIDHRKYAEAMPYLDKGDMIATQTRSPLMIFQAQMIKGRFWEETGKPDQAIAVLTQALPVAKQFSRELYSNVLKFMALAQKGLGNTNTALQYFELYAQQSDSLTKEKLSTNFADQETRYETSQKEQRIISLNKENRLNVLELENAAHTRVLLVLGLVALGIIALLLYFIYRNKENLNRILNEKNEQFAITNRQLALANDTKARLFGIISHDLRSPVSRIVQLLEIQKQKPELLDETARRRHDERLRSASENVLETMEDLLLWSKSQMQHFTPQPMTLRVGELVQKEIGLLKEPIEEKSIRIDQQVSEEFLLTTDENFLAVILRNLLQNAVKYSDEGSSISITAEGRNLSITNQSAKADAASLNARMRNEKIDSGGSGLGLQIARDLAASLGANITFVQHGNKLTAILSWEDQAATR
ncbi:MAG TPA: HAMP domain-containing sensor histidine kinase [Puia sp.]|nr:HAMP domain-containing sensor histidine kinase [Puia sp.]